MKEHIILFLKHYFDLLDYSLGLVDTPTDVQAIIDKYKALQEKVRKDPTTTEEEFINLEADIFLEYLQIKGVNIN